MLATQGKGSKCLFKRRPQFYVGHAGPHIEVHFNCGVGFALATQGKGSKGPFLKAAPLLCRARRATVRSAFAIWQYGFWLMLATLGIGSECLFLFEGGLTCMLATQGQIYGGRAGQMPEAPFKGDLNFMLATQGHASNSPLRVA